MRQQINLKELKEKENEGWQVRINVVDNFHSLVVDFMDHLLEKTVKFCLISYLKTSRIYVSDNFLGKNKAPAVAINLPTTSTLGGKLYSISSFLTISYGSHRTQLKSHL